MLFIIIITITIICVFSLPLLGSVFWPHILCENMASTVLQKHN